MWNRRVKAVEWDGCLSGIARHIDTTRQRILVSFWNVLEEKLRTALAEESKRGWQLKTDPDMSAHYAGVSILPVGSPTARFVYQLGRDTNFINSIGVQGATDIRGDERERPAFREAVKLAQELDCCVTGNQPRGIGWSRCGLTFNDQDDMLIAMVENTETLCAGIVEKASGDFKKVAGMIRELNRPKTE